MAKDSRRTSRNAASRSSSKRPHPSESEVRSNTLSKRPKRQSVSKSEPTASNSAAQVASEDETEDTEPSDDQDSADYEGSLASSSPEDEIESDFSEEDAELTNRSRGSVKHKTGKSKTASKIERNKALTNTSKSDLLRPGAETGLAPGIQLVIKKPKARNAGSTPFTAETIHPNTFLFLDDLAANNDRQWLKMHDPDYRASLQDFNTYVECLTQKVVEIDETVPELPVKDITFRIHRDVRFSKDQTPYKTTFSAAWSRTGRKGPYAAYYMQIKPNGGSLVAGGLWTPEADALALLRRDFDRRPERIKQVLKDPAIRKMFLDGVANDDGRVIKKFVAHNSENALKTKPKGFDSDHKDIELLRLRSFSLSKKIRDEDVLGPQSLDHFAKIISCLVPFVTYLNSVVMPDEQTSDEAENDEDDAGEEDDEA